MEQEIIKEGPIKNFLFDAIMDGDLESRWSRVDICRILKMSDNWHELKNEKFKLTLIPVFNKLKDNGVYMTSKKGVYRIMNDREKLEVKFKEQQNRIHSTIKDQARCLASINPAELTMEQKQDLTSKQSKTAFMRMAFKKSKKIDHETKSEDIPKLKGLIDKQARFNGMASCGLAVQGGVWQGKNLNRGTNEKIQKYAESG